jgi:hypothetical protein
MTKSGATIITAATAITPPITMNNLRDAADGPGDPEILNALVLLGERNEDRVIEATRRIGHLAELTDGTVAVAELAGLLAAAFCTLASTIAYAQDFPRRAISLILPFAAGGVTDQVARLVASKVADNIGYPVVVENRPGGGSQIAAGAVKQAQPDGYTILVGDIGTHAINVSLYNKLSYEPLKDFVPVTELVEMPHATVCVCVCINFQLHVACVSVIVRLARRELA